MAFKLLNETAWKVQAFFAAESEGCLFLIRSHEEFGFTRLCCKVSKKFKSVS